MPLDTQYPTPGIGLRQCRPSSETHLGAGQRHSTAAAAAAPGEREGEDEAEEEEGARTKLRGKKGRGEKASWGRQCLVGLCEEGESGERGGEGKEGRGKQEKKKGKRTHPFRHDPDAVRRPSCSANVRSSECRSINS